MSAAGMGGKVNPHNLRVGVIRDWDSRWNQDSHISGDFFEREKYSGIPNVVGKVKEWNNQRDRGMKNVPQKKPHHK